MITWCLQVSNPNKKGLPLCLLTSDIDVFKTPPHPFAPSWPHKYDNYDKAPCIVFSYL